MSSYTKNISNTFITPRKSHFECRVQTEGHGKTPPTIAPRSNSPYIQQSHYKFKLLPKCQGNCSFSMSYLKQIASLEQYIETLLKIQLQKEDTIRILQRRLCQHRSIVITERQQTNLKESQTILIQQLNEKIKKILSENSRLKQQLSEYKQYSQKLLIDHRQEKRKWEIQMSALINEANLLKQQLQAYCCQLQKKAHKSQVKIKHNPICFEIGIQCSISQLTPSRLRQMQSIYSHKINQLVHEQENKWITVTQRVIEGQRKLDRIQAFQHQLQFQKNVRIQKTVQQSKINLSKAQALRGQDNHQIDQHDDEIHYIIAEQAKNTQKPILPVIRPVPRSQIKPVYTVIQRRPPPPVNFVYTSSFGQKTLNNAYGQVTVERPIIEHQQNLCTQQIAKLHQVIRHKDQIIKLLQNNLNRLSQEPIKKVEQVQIPEDFYNQLQTIRKHLLSCNPSNYQKFFQDMEQIIKERNQMKTQIIKLQQIASMNYQANHYETEKQLLFEKSANQTLRKKNQLNEEQIRKLNLKITELQQCIEKIRNTQFTKSKIVVNQQIKEGPQGYDALEWQKAVRNCIDDTLLRLQALQQRAKRSQNRQTSQIVYTQRPIRTNSMLVRQIET